MKAKLYQANFVSLRLQHVAVQIPPAVAVCFSFLEKTYTSDISRSSIPARPCIRVYDGNERY